MRDSRRTRLVLALLLLAAFVLITLDFRGGASKLGALRDAGAAVFGPIEDAAGAAARPVGDTIQRVFGGGDQQKQVKELRRRNAKLQAQLRSAKLSGTRSEELDQLLDLAGRGRYRIVPAKTVAMRSGLGFEHTATIDVGRRDGVRKNMTVVSGAGLVGRVVHAGATTSTVLLAMDGGSHVGVRMEDSHEIGVLTGEGLGQMRLKLLDSDTPLRRGDRLVTFGSQGGEPYVPGVPIGAVTSVKKDPGSLTLKATVRPFVDFSALDLVGVVVKPPKDNPRDSVLPPKPETSSPGASPEGSDEHGPHGD